MPTSSEKDKNKIRFMLLSMKKTTNIGRQLTVSVTNYVFEEY